MYQVLGIIYSADGINNSTPPSPLLELIDWKPSFVYLTKIDLKKLTYWITTSWVMVGNTNFFIYMFLYSWNKLIDIFQS